MAEELEQNKRKIKAEIHYFKIQILFVFATKFVKFKTSPNYLFRWAARSFLQPPPPPLSHCVNPWPILPEAENAGNSFAVWLVWFKLVVAENLVIDISNTRLEMINDFKYLWVLLDHTIILEGPCRVYSNSISPTLGRLCRARKVFLKATWLSNPL